ncbi:MAG TPA: 7TM diverse intracellular signaling domain-containing protein [Ramlibacter sp.]|nr:7TM diverse intracellular signaling domain-containing protein [Ramlibacter sp.]
MRRFVYGWGAVLLWLMSLAAAFAQELPAAGSRAAVPPPPIVLTPQQPVVSLDGRSRYWLDPTEVRTIDQIEATSQTLPWSLRASNGSYNVDGRALWIQFDAVGTSEQRWFVQLGSSGIDRVQLFYRGADGRWVAQEAGDTKPVSQWPLPGRFPTFELSPIAGKPVRYWLRIEHARVDFASPIAIYDQTSLLAEREREQLLLGAYFGLAALIALVAAANAVAYRDRNFGVYAFYVALLAIGQLAYLGVGAEHVWDRWLKWNEMATFLLPGLSSAAGLWFARTVTEPARFSKALDLAVWSLLAAILSAVALDTFLASRNSFALVMVLTLVVLAVVVGLIVLVWAQGEDPYIRLIALGFLPVIVMALFPVARGLTLIPASALTRYGLSIGAVIEMPILFYALSLRGSRRREAQVRAAALSRNDTLTGLAHTRTLLHRLEGAIARARSLKHACALMAVKISNFDAIAAEYGRETADRVLVVAASLLRHAITDIDLAARVSEHSFALLLEGPTTTENAISRAQHVVASGLRSSNALPPGTTLKFHVAVALLPDKDLDAPGSMKWLLESVGAMPADALKLIRPMNF